jgi:Ssp1 endopeptidase immunity protein Rap1a
LKRVILPVLLDSASLGAAAQSVSNDTFTAGSLYSACTHNVSNVKTKEDIESLELICNVYLRGLRDALFVMQSLANRGQRTCLPWEEAIDLTEARRVFQAYLQAHPQSIADSAGLVAAMSLVAAYKCQ